MKGARPCRLGVMSDWAEQACRSGNVRNALPAQPVDATQVLNLSAGVSNAKVFRGRSFS
jgi:hypothetical protein